MIPPQAVGWVTAECGYRPSMGGRPVTRRHTLCVIGLRSRKLGDVRSPARVRHCRCTRPTLRSTGRQPCSSILKSNKTYKPRCIGIFGTSAGAILTGEVAVKLKQLGLPPPGALGMFSTLADFSRPSDSRQLFTLNGFPGALQPVDPQHLPNNEYAAKTDLKDPVLSPLFADLHGMPPSLLITSTRDLLLSDTATFHRALLAAGDDAQLVVFEALPHAFWYHFQLPETKEALEVMAKFFDAKVEH